MAAVVFFMALLSAVQRFVLFLVWTEELAGRPWRCTCEAGPSPIE